MVMVRVSTTRNREIYTVEQEYIETRADRTASGIGGVWWATSFRGSAVMSIVGCREQKLIRQ